MTNPYLVGIAVFTILLLASWKYLVPIAVFLVILTNAAMRSSFGG